MCEGANVACADCATVDLCAPKVAPPAGWPNKYAALFVSFYHANNFLIGFALICVS